MPSRSATHSGASSPRWPAAASPVESRRINRASLAVQPIGNVSYRRLYHPSIDLARLYVAAGCILEGFELAFAGLAGADGEGLVGGEALDPADPVGPPAAPGFLRPGDEGLEREIGKASCRERGCKSV